MTYLSPRQQEVVALVQTQGPDRRQIARTLGISPATVRTHLRAIVDRLPPAYHYPNPCLGILLWSLHSAKEHPSP